MSKIPKISDEKLFALAKKITPMHASRMSPTAQNALFAYEFKHNNRNLKHMGFFWIKDAKKIQVDRSNLPTELTRIPTYHEGCFSFAPSIEEVIAQIPEEYLDKVVSFEVVTPERGICSAKYQELYDDEYHIAETILYTAA